MSPQLFDFMNSVFALVDVDPSDAVSQVGATVVDLLPYVIASAIVCLALIWLWRVLSGHEMTEKEWFEEDGADWDALQARLAADAEEDDGQRWSGAAMISDLEENDGERWVAAYRDEEQRGLDSEISKAEGS